MYLNIKEIKHNDDTHNRLYFIKKGKEINIILYLLPFSNCVPAQSALVHKLYSESGVISDVPEASYTNR